MPLSLRSPRKGKTPNFEIRGTYLGCRVEVSSGTNKRSVARKQLKRITECIEEHGQYPAPELKPDPGQPTFLSAAIAYMRDGGERKYVAFLLRHFGETPLPEISQTAIDAAAEKLLPNGAPDYRNRKVYTPVSAILHHALGENCPTFKRPKGSKGRERKEFMWPEDAFAIIRKAGEIIDAEFELYLLLLLYDGIRKSEGLDALAADMRPEDCLLWLRDSKNGDPRMLQIRQDLARRFEEHLAANPGRDRLFRFKDGGHFKHLLLRCTMAVCGLECPKRRPTGWKKPKFRLAFVAFHTFRHTWATWMRMFGGADLQGLVGTKNWKDPKSVARYAHVVPRDEWDRVEKLPSMEPGNSRGKAVNE